jgi:hypothetical protein
VLYTEVHWKCVHTVYSEKFQCHDNVAKLDKVGGGGGSGAVLARRVTHNCK